VLQSCANHIHATPFHVLWHELTTTIKLPFG
jgi:hypothetical protein